MKRLTVIAVVVVCLLAEAGLSPQLARADGNIRCAREDMNSGACVIEVRAPGSGGQPGEIPARPRQHTGTGNTGGDSEEKSPGHIEGCIRYALFSGECLIFEPSESPESNPGGAPEPVVLARVAVERMDLRAPEIGLWPEPLERLPAGHNYVGWHNWMWIRDPGPATWGPITRTVTEAGYAITATAAVTKVTWEMGNGDTKVCDKGMEHLTWQEDDKPSPTCGYVYHQRGDYTITATAHWVIVWSGLGQRGTIEMDLSSRVHTSVIEAFAVNVPNGRRHGLPSPSLSPNPTGTPTALAPCPTNHNKHGC